MNAEANKPVRHYDVDWLRIFAMIAVFLLHSARIFDFEPWHVKNNQLSLGMNIIVAFITLWVMPLFFVLSGESTNFSLSSKQGGQYLRERVKRLFIPFVFGIFLLAPPQVYLERLGDSQFNGTFIQFFPVYFDGVYGFGGNFAWMGLHLWYLLVLLIFSLITLPLFLHLKKEKPYPVCAHARQVTTFLNKPGSIFLLAVPPATVFVFSDLLFLPGGVLSGWGSLVNFGGWNIFVYIIFFIYGYLLASNQFTNSIRRHRTIALVLGIVLSVPLLLSLISWNPSSLGYPFGYILVYFLATFSSWSWVIAILGLANAKLSFNHRWLRGATEAALPFYILHQPVIVIFGFYIVKLDLSVIAKYAFITALSMAATIILLQIIKRTGVLRFLFGMRTTQKP